MDQGFIKLWRKSIDSAVFQDASLWKLWTWCLIRANHKDVFVPIKTGRGQAIIELKRGQFIFGRRTAAKVLKMKPSTIGYRLQILEKLHNLDRQVNHHFTIVTIRNYDKYNDIKNNLDRQVNHQLTTNCPPTDTDKNYKNKKNDKKDPKTFSSEFELFWKAFDYKQGKKPAYEKSWCKIPDLTDELVEKIIEGAKRYAVERPNILARGDKPKWAQGWLTDRRWEDEIVSQPHRPLTENAKKDLLFNMYLQDEVQQNESSSRSSEVIDIKNGTETTNPAIGALPGERTDG